MQADTSRLLLMVVMMVMGTAAKSGASALILNRSDHATIDCGATPTHPTNITVLGGPATQLYTEGGTLQCHSKAHKVAGSQLHAHVIYDVFRRECGFRINSDGDIYTTTVLVHHSHPKDPSAAEGTTHALSCHFHKVHTTAQQTSPEPWQSDVHSLPLSGKDTRRNLFGIGENSFPLQDEAKTSSYADYVGDSDAIHLTSPPSVLELNVIDADGSMTAVVYPGKRIALELHSHHTPLGVPVVTSCRLTDPLKTSGHGAEKTPASNIFLRHGCGVGQVLPRSAGFTKGKQGYTTPFFPVASDWTHQAALMFSCDVTVCADARRCRKTCPPQRQRSVTPDPHDVTLLLESQVVTSCPSIHDAQSTGDVSWSESLLPECLPEGYLLHQPLAPSTEPEVNMTTNDSSSSTTASRAAPHPPTARLTGSWLAGHLPYVVTICLLGLLVFLFMMATFCKMAAMHRHVRRSNKAVAAAAAAAARERAEEMERRREQATQTPRPLPRTPNGRSHSLQRQSRQGGDGASMPVLHHHDDGAHGSSSSRPTSGVQAHAADAGLEPASPHPPPPPPPPPSAGRKNSAGRPQPYDIPPSHDQQLEFRMSRGSVSPTSSPPTSPTSPGPGHVVQESGRRSCEVTTFHTSVTAEEKPPERHSTIVQIKPPQQPGNHHHHQHHHQQQQQRLPSDVPPCMWKAPPPEHLGSFTGGNSGTLERGVVLGVNSLRRHLDREQQQVASQPRDRRPITARQPEPDTTSTPTALLYYNTPALCSEDSSLKELLHGSQDAVYARAGPGGGGGIRTSPHRGSRKGGAPVAVNTVEETTRL